MRSEVKTPRYVVTELEGWRGVSTSSRQRIGLSCHVLDTVYNRRVVATFRSEDRLGNRVGRFLKGGGTRGHEGARAAAVALARELNRA